MQHKTSARKLASLQLISPNPLQEETSLRIMSNLLSRLSYVATSPFARVYSVYAVRSSVSRTPSHMRCPSPTLSLVSQEVFHTLEPRARRFTLPAKPGLLPQVSSNAYMHANLTDSTLVKA